MITRSKAGATIGSLQTVTRAGNVTLHTAAEGENQLVRTQLEPIVQCRQPIVRRQRQPRARRFGGHGGVGIGGAGIGIGGGGAGIGGGGVGIGKETNTETEQSTETAIKQTSGNTQNSRNFRNKNTKSVKFGVKKSSYNAQGELCQSIPWLTAGKMTDSLATEVFLMNKDLMTVL